MAAIPKQSLFTATVIEVLADTGGAVVQPNVSSPNKQTRLIVATLPYCDAASGALPYHMYPAGSTVLCSWRRDGSEDICYIVGGLNVNLDPRIWGYKSHKAYNAEYFAQAFANVLSDWKLLERLCPDGKHVWLRDRSHGASGDALAGDYDIQDRTGFGGLHIGRLVSQLKGSALTFVDTSVTDSRLRLVADSLENHTLVTEAVSNGLYTVRNTAISIPESFGLRKGAVLRKNDKERRIESANEDAIPLYRMQHMSGAILDGSEDIVVGFSTDNNQQVHDSAHEPPVLAKRRAALSGELTDASAYGINSIKSPFFHAAMQLGYGLKPKDGEKYDDLREPYAETLTESKGFKEQEEKRARAASNEQRRDVSDAALNKLIDTLLEGDYRDALLKIMAEKGFSKTNANASVYGAIKNKKHIGGPCDTGEYPLPESITLTDPVTGEEKTYFASLSFITQEPDGSICICDGYGSEIRMCRGNIYISPALDCFVRPGRDFSLMAGRHQSFNSQETFTISTGGSGYIQAQSDLKIGGAQSGDGLVVLESGNTINQEDKGLVIRSLQNASFTVTNGMYIGRNSHTLENDNADNPDDRGGTVVIDAGLRGHIYTRCQTAMLDTMTLTACASSNTSGSSFTLMPGVFTVNAVTTQLTGSALLAPVATAEYVTVIRNGEDNAIKVADPTAHCDIIVNGNIAINGDFQANGSGVFREQMIAGQVSGNSRYNDISGQPPEAKDVLTTKMDMPTIESRNAHETAVLQAVSNIYQNYYVTANAFSFPETYNVTCPIMPGMVWQQESRSQGGSTWDEKYVKDTACYPGMDVWKGQRISVEGYGTPVAVQGGYVINVKKEKSNG